MYGNIGVPERLQFTIIGAAANEAARLAGLCKTLGQAILISSAFPRCFPNEMISLGFQHLRGVEHTQEIFTLSDGRLTRARMAHNRPPNTGDRCVSGERRPRDAAINQMNLENPMVITGSVVSRSRCR